MSADPTTWLLAAREIVPTVDGRAFTRDALTWRDPPWPLMRLDDGYGGASAGGLVVEFARFGLEVLARCDIDDHGDRVRTDLGLLVAAIDVVVEDSFVPTVSDGLVIRHATILGVTLVPAEQAPWPTAYQWRPR